jgi:hypothetical protein
MFGSDRVPPDRLHARFVIDDELFNQSAIEATPRWSCGVAFPMKSFKGSVFSKFDLWRVEVAANPCQLNRSMQHYLIS